MKIRYADKRLKGLCDSHRQAKRRIGEAGAKILQRRLAQIDAAPTVRDLPAGNPHPLKGDHNGQFSVSLDGGRRLVFEPDHEEVPTTADKAVDWERVTDVCITFIGDYHD